MTIENTEAAGVQSAVQTVRARVAAAFLRLREFIERIASAFNRGCRVVSDAFTLACINLLTMFGSLAMLGGFHALAVFAFGFAIALGAAVY